METLNGKVKDLLKQKDKADIVRKLQEINQCLITEARIVLNERLSIYPIEVESYFYHPEHFPDTTVHRNELQRKRYAQLYLHRIGETATSGLYAENRGGIDICLSDDEKSFYGVLIRSAWINTSNEDNIECGPANLKKRILKEYDETITKATQKDVITKIEDIKDVVQPSDNTERLNATVYHSNRYGINPRHGEYCLYKLRSLIDLANSKYSFKDKEQVAISYIESNVLGITDKTVKDVLGYHSTAITEYFKRKEITL